MKVITANRLDTGRVVFLGTDGDWVSDIGAAQVFDDDGVAAALARHEARVKEIADIYAIDAAADGAPAGRAALRETIRASGGPTVAYPGSSGAPAS